MTLGISNASTSAAGAVQLATDGETNALKAVNGNDSRLNDPRLTIKKAGTTVGKRRSLNLIEGSNVTMTVTDDLANDKVDVTINASVTGGGSTNGLTTVYYSDDFITGTNEQGETGILGWSPSGSGSCTYQAGESGHPGIIRLTSPSTSGNSGELLYLSQAPATNPLYYATHDKLKMVIRLQSTASTQFIAGMKVDISNLSGSQHGAFFSFDTSQSSFWQTVTRQSAVETRNTTSVSVAANTWYQLEIRLNGSTWEFWINGSLVTSHTTNTPASALNIGMSIDTLTTSAKTVDVDYIDFSQTAITQRY